MMDDGTAEVVPLFRETIDDHLAAARTYIDTVEEVSGDLDDERAIAATRELANSIRNLVQAHHMHAGGDFPWGASERPARPEEESDDFAFPGEDDPYWARQPERIPRFEEIPVYIPLGQVIAEGDWGVVRLRQAIVYTSGMNLEVEQLRVRLPTQSEEDWAELDMVSERETELTFDGGRRIASLAGGHGTGGSFGARQSVRSFWLEGNLSEMHPGCEVRIFTETGLVPVRFALDLVALAAEKDNVRVL
jgi:hypothetical protein